VTASVIQWSEFLATDPEARVRFPALPDFLKEKKKEKSSGRWDGVMWTGLVWLRIGTGGELL
jgi:hypothetical protein